MDFLLLTIFLLLVVSPVLSIVALVRQVRLQKRLTALEKRLVADAAVDAGRERTSVRDVPTPATETPVSGASAPGVGPIRPRQDWETLIAGRWMSLVGILALLLATGFFLKFAFDNNWVGPRGRVAIGLLGGAGLFVYSNWLSRQRYRYFSDGIAGLGAGVLYLSLLAGWSFYAVFPLPAAFVGMVAVTSTLVVLSIGRNSQVLGILGVVGGLLTPALLDTGRDAQVELFCYLAILSAGMLILGRKRDWISVEWLAFVGTVLHLAAWSSANYSPSKLQPTLLFCVVFFLEFAAAPAWRVKRGQSLQASGIGQVLLNAFWFLAALHIMLYDDHRWSLTVCVLILSLLYLALAHLGRVEGRSWTPGILYAGLALTMATLAIAIRLEGRWITMAWAIEGGILTWSGFRSRLKLMRGAGLLLLGVAAGRLLLIPIPAGRLFLNARFMAFAVTVAGVGLALAGTRLRTGETFSKLELTLFATLAIAINLLSLWALSREIWDLFAGSRFGVDSRLAQQLGLSVLWTAYAAALVGLGAAKRSKLLRWQGLVLLGVVALKAFLFDLSFLQRGYRIISFLALGVLLLTVSYMYQRRSAGSAPEGS